MDALPVTEQTDVPFKSKVKAQFRGETVGVMHACGHDSHVAIMLGVAEVFAGMRDRLAGQVLFVFQPAEEGPPEGERGGAILMLEQGAFKMAKPDVMYGLHVMASLPSGVIGYRAGPLMAGADSFTLVVKGRQTHGSRPWGGVDPIVVSSQVVQGLQNIVSRQLDITAIPAVITVGAIKGGIRFNIIPDEVQMIGTVRTFSTDVRNDIVRRMQTTASSIAQASGATATVRFKDLAKPESSDEISLPPVVNDAAVPPPPCPSSSGWSARTTCAKSRCRLPPRISLSSASRCPRCSSGSVLRRVTATCNRPRSTTRRSSISTRPACRLACARLHCRSTDERSAGQAANVSGAAWVPAWPPDPLRARSTCCLRCNPAARGHRIPAVRCSAPRRRACHRRCPRSCR